MGILRKVSKEIKYTCEKTYAIPIVKGNGFRNFNVSRINMK
jgi:hypothetical protein